MGLACGPCMADVKSEDLRAWKSPPLWQLRIRDGDDDGCDFCLQDALLLKDFGLFSWKLIQFCISLAYRH
jgi:hypothetical protein